MINSTLSLRALSKRYGGVVAVDAIDLDVPEGEFLTLLGPSGSGKTTALMLIAGFEEPSGGEIAIGGQAMTHVPSHLRHVGVIFQNYALFPHLDVFENVAFALRNLGWRSSAIRDRVAELLALVSLVGLERRLPSQLSGGQQQRVAIARALAFQPRLLLLDEPLGALDKRLRERMLVELRRIHRTLGVTMIYVTHDQDEALAMSDRIAVMNHGRLIQIGTPQQLYEWPADRFVAEFLGDTNVLDGTGADDHKVDLAGWTIAVCSDVPRSRPVSVVVRPERMTLGRGRSGWNRGSGVIDDVIYLGRSTRYRIRTSTERIVTIAVVPARGTDVPSIGDQVDFSWDPVHGVCLPGDAT